MVGRGLGCQKIRFKKNLNKKRLSEFNLKRRNPVFLPRRREGEFKKVGWRKEQAKFEKVVVEEVKDGR